MNLFSVVLLLAATALGQGSGPYPAHYFEDPSLVNHTIYQPRNTTGLKLPVIAWANGGCFTNGTGFANFLTQVASYGAIAVAVGPINGSVDFVFPPGNDTDSIPIFPERQKAAIDWIVKVAGTGNYSHVDCSRIAVWGQSCGGLESYANWENEHVSSIGIFNSGMLRANDTLRVVTKITKPIFYFLGGSTDIAYDNGERDYDSLPTSTSAWLGNHAMGHGATFNETDGGLVGVAAVKYLQWLLRGNSTAAEWFTSGEALRNGFVDQKYKNVESIKVTPIGG